MVFVAVFAATSGVVYLVLQKLLPPDAAPGRPARRMPRKDDYDDIPVRRSAPRPAAPAQRPASPNRAAAPSRPAAAPSRQAAPRAYTGEWVCPRDRSRNSGPYCTLCGAPRPQAPRPAAPRPAANGGAQRPAQPAARPVQPAPQPVQRQPQAQSFQPAPKAAPTPAWQEPDLLDAYLTEPTEPTFTEAAPLADAPQDLLSALRSVRNQIALEENVPAYIVFSNATLADMAQKQPRTRAEFLEVSGVGENKRKKYGRQFLEAIAEFQ